MRLLASSRLSSVLPSGLLSVCPHATTRLPLDGFYEILYLSFFENLFKIQVLLNSDTKNWYFTWRRLYIYDNIRANYSQMIYVSDKFVEKIKTHILYSASFFQNSCHLWDNVEKYGGPRQATNQNITRRMHFACWIIQDPHTQYVILTAFSRQQWFRERASILSS